MRRNSTLRSIVIKADFKGVIAYLYRSQWLRGLRRRSASSVLLLFHFQFLLSDLPSTAVGTFIIIIIIISSSSSSSSSSCCCCCCFQRTFWFILPNRVVQVACNWLLIRIPKLNTHILKLHEPGDCSGVIRFGGYVTATAAYHWVL